MSTQLTIEGRLVQGGLTLRAKADMKTKQPKLDKNGQPVQECFMAIAVPKDDPNLGTYYAAFDAQARASFPHLFPNGGACTHPRFAMKWQDGDGVDGNGASVADNEGFAGHWVIKMATQFAPTCYERNAHGQLVQLTDPERVIKRGDYVAVGVTINGNGVEPGNAQAVPGLFVSPNIVLFVRKGQEILAGPDPNAAFAGIATQPSGVAGATVGALPGPPAPGAMPAPAPAAAPPMPPAAAPAPGPVMPQPAAAPTPTPMPMPGMTPPGASMPAPPAAPQYATTASAQGATLDALLGAGWTIDALLAAGHITRTA